MKTFKQFNEESRQIAEVMGYNQNPLGPLTVAGKAIGGLYKAGKFAAYDAPKYVGGKLLTGLDKGLAVSSLVDAGGKLRKGDVKGALVDAGSAVTGGKIYKGLKAAKLPKRIGQIGSTAQSIYRHSSDAAGRYYDKVYKAAGNIGKAAAPIVSGGITKGREKIDAIKNKYFKKNIRPRSVPGGQKLLKKVIKK